MTFTHAILKNKMYFSYLKMKKINANTISGSSKLIESSRKATLFLPKGTKIVIYNALISLKSQKNLLSFKDICQNGYHIETMNETNGKFLLIINTIYGKKNVY